MGSNRPVRHHTIPRFLLENFAKDGEVCMVRRSGGGTCKLSVDKASVQKNFYKVDTEGVDPYWFEVLLGKNLENSASFIIRKILNHELLDFEERATLSLFVYVQIVRTQVFRSRLQHAISTSLIENGIDEFEVDSSFHVGVIHKLCRNLDLIMMFLERPMLFVSVDGYGLPMPDAGVTSYTCLDDDRQFRQLGIRTAPGLVLPLSRYMALVMGERCDNDRVVFGHYDEFVVGSDYDLACVVHSLLSGAHDRVFFHPDDAQYSSIYQDVRS